MLLENLLIKYKGVYEIMWKIYKFWVHTRLYIKNAKKLLEK